MFCGGLSDAVLGDAKQTYESVRENGLKGEKKERKREMHRDSMVPVVVHILLFKASWKRIRRRSIRRRKRGRMKS